MGGEQARFHYLSRLSLTQLDTHRNDCVVESEREGRVQNPEELDCNSRVLNDGAAVFIARSIDGCVWTALGPLFYTFKAVDACVRPFKKKKA